MRTFRLKFSGSYTPVFSLLKFVVTTGKDSIFPDIICNSPIIISLDKIYFSLVKNPEQRLWKG